MYRLQLTLLVLRRRPLPIDEHERVALLDALCALMERPSSGSFNSKLKGRDADNTPLETEVWALACLAELAPFLCDSVPAALMDRDEHATRMAQSLRKTMDAAVQKLSLHQTVFAEAAFSFLHALLTADLMEPHAFETALPDICRAVTEYPKLCSQAALDFIHGALARWDLPASLQPLRTKLLLWVLQFAPQSTASASMIQHWINAVIALVRPGAAVVAPRAAGADLLHADETLMFQFIAADTTGNVEAELHAAAALRDFNSPPLPPSRAARLARNDIPAQLRHTLQELLSEHLNMRKEALLADATDIIQGRKRTLGVDKVQLSASLVSLLSHAALLSGLLHVFSARSSSVGAQVSLHLADMLAFARSHFETLAPESDKQLPVLRALSIFLVACAPQQLSAACVDSLADIGELLAQLVRQVEEAAASALLRSPSAAGMSTSNTSLMASQSDEMLLDEVEFGARTAASTSSDQCMTVAAAALRSLGRMLPPARVAFLHEHWLHLCRADAHLAMLAVDACGGLASSRMTLSAPAQRQLSEGLAHLLRSPQHSGSGWVRAEVLKLLVSLLSPATPAMDTPTTNGLVSTAPGRTSLHRLLEVYKAWWTSKKLCWRCRALLCAAVRQVVAAPAGLEPEASAAEEFNNLFVESLEDVDFRVRAYMGKAIVGMLLALVCFWNVHLLISYWAVLFEMWNEHENIWTDVWQRIAPHVDLAGGAELDFVFLSCFLTDSCAADGALFDDGCFLTALVTMGEIAAVSPDSEKFILSRLCQLCARARIRGLAEAEAQASALLRALAVRFGYGSLAEYVVDNVQDVLGEWIAERKRHQLQLGAFPVRLHLLICARGLTTCVAIFQVQLVGCTDYADFLLRFMGKSKNACLRSSL